MTQGRFELSLAIAVTTSSTSGELPTEEDHYLFLNRPGKPVRKGVTTKNAFFAVLRNGWSLIHRIDLPQWGDLRRQLLYLRTEAGRARLTHGLVQAQMRHVLPYLSHRCRIGCR